MNPLEGVSIKFVVAAVGLTSLLMAAVGILLWWIAVRRGRAD